MKFKKTIYTSLTAVALLAPAATGLVQSSVPSIVNAQSSKQYAIANYQWNQDAFEKLSASKKQAILDEFVAKSQDALGLDGRVQSVKAVFITGAQDGNSLVNTLITDMNPKSREKQLKEAENESQPIRDTLKRMFANDDLLAKILIENNVATLKDGSSTPTPKPKDPSTPTPKPKESGKDTPKPKESGKDTPKPKESGKDTTKPEESGKDSTKPEGSGKDSTKPEGSGKDSTKPEGSGKDSTKPEDSNGTPVTSTTGVSEESNIPQAGSEEQGLFAKIVAFIVGLFN